MILKKATITDFRGINGTTTIRFNLFNCIVGQNDAGKSTILKAIDAFLNETTLNKSDLNVDSPNNEISVELSFDFQNKELALGEEILTTLEEEELVSEEGLVIIRKSWTVGETTISKPKTSIIRKKYSEPNDFIFKTETQLIAHCKSNNIETTKGNGEQYNNVEKRAKIRDYNRQRQIEFFYVYEEIPGSGTSKLKTIGDAIRKALPNFQYFRADTSLSDTDNTIQKYFKDIAFKLIKNGINTDEIEFAVKAQLSSVLEKVTSKINEVVKSSEKVEPKIDFDWSKLISTSFVSTSTGNDIPLSSRGDGFRRITMMSYFEYLAESERTYESQKIIFGFEEPETFLHPSAQSNLFDKLSALSENGFQVLVSTHSPTICGNANSHNIIHVSRNNGQYTITQDEVDYKTLAVDLGIKPDNTFTPLFSTSRLLLLVEGIDDAKALHHKATLYKQSGLIPKTFEELSIAIIPIGGCGGVKHWVNLDLFTKLEKPFHIFLDSDKENDTSNSPNEENLIAYGLIADQDFTITKKRSLENYIHPTALQRLVPGTSVTYTDYDHAKNFCKNYPDSNLRASLGGAKVVEKHYLSLTFEDLRLTWFDGTQDEFIDLYNRVAAKLNHIPELNN